MAMISPEFGAERHGVELDLGSNPGRCKMSVNALIFRRVTSLFPKQTFDRGLVSGLLFIYLILFFSIFKTKMTKENKNRGF